MEISESDRKLINEGAVQYFDALRALREFRELILRLCAGVVQRRGEDLAKAMGTHVDISTASNGVWPDKHGDLLKQALWKRASIWRHLYFPEFGSAYWGISCVPESTRGDKAIAVYARVGFETDNAAIRERALRRFKKPGVARIENLDGNEVDIREKLDSGEIHRFPEALERMTEEWIKIWQYVGGLPGIAEGAEPQNG